MDMIPDLISPNSLDIIFAQMYHSQL